MKVKQVLLCCIMGVIATPVLGDTCCDTSPVAIHAAASLADVIKMDNAWLGVFDVPLRIPPTTPTGENDDILPGLFELRVHHNVVPLKLVESLHGNIPNLIFIVDPRHNRAVLDQSPFPFHGLPESRWLLAVIPDNQNVNLPSTLEVVGNIEETVKIIQANTVRLAGDEHGTVCLKYPEKMAKRLESMDPNWREHQMAYAFGDDKLLEDVRRIVQLYHVEQARKKGLTVTDGERIDSFKTEFGGIMFQRLLSSEAVLK